MKAHPAVSIVIVNYRSVVRLARLLESLTLHETSSKQDTEIIVINNDPLEVQVLRKLRSFFQFSLIENSDNVGFARGANIGASTASGEFIGFINPDTVWQQASLSGICSLFLQHPSIGIIGMHLTNSAGITENFSFGKHHSLLQIMRDHLFPKNSYADTRNPLLLHDRVSGGGLFIRKQLFQNLDGFDEQFFLYFEDADLCLRATQNSYDIGLARMFPLIHDGGKSQISSFSQKRYFYDSQNIYFKKHRPAWEYSLLRILRHIRHGS